MAAAGLFLSVAGVAAWPALIDAGLQIGIKGLHLAGRFASDSFHTTEGSDTTSRVLFFNDVLKWIPNERKVGIILLFHVSVRGTQLKISRLTKEASPGIYQVGTIIDGNCDDKRDIYTVNLIGALKLTPRRYISFPDMVPHGIISKSTDWTNIPEPGSGILFDTSGLLQEYYPQKKENHEKDLFAKCTFEYRKDYIMTLVQGESDVIGGNLSVVNLPDEKNTIVLKMQSWKCNYLGNRIGNALDNEFGKVLELIRDNKGHWGYQWIRDSQKRNYGDVYALSVPHDGDSLSHSPTSQLFFVIDDKAWTYALNVSKAE
ncbi:hypothetical protein TrVFT333_002306 [Trichoderma virens FT-333]|nr:hypothetical protein TrVFT333_002306 [Trichoderma virens FT-333]